MRSVLERQREALLEGHPHLRPVADRLARAASPVPVKADVATIVITCKNKVTSLPAVLGRIAEQTRRPDLVVLADDASTDRSVALFIELCREHGLAWRLAALPMGGNYRLNTIRNRGFERSLDGIVMLIDGDLILSPVYVARHLALHARQPVPVASMGPRFEYADDALAGPVNFMWGYGSEQQGLGPEGYLPAWQRAHGAMCLPRGVWQAVGGFDEGYNGRYGIDDIDFLFRLFLAGVFPVSDFEGYCIHVPHATGFEGGGRDPHGNIDYFRAKYGLPETVLWDPVDHTPLHTRKQNWALDFGEFLRTSGAAGSPAR